MATKLDDDFCLLKALAGKHENSGNRKRSRPSGPSAPVPSRRVVIDSQTLEEIDSDEGNASAPADAAPVAQAVPETPASVPEPLAEDPSVEAPRAPAPCKPDKSLAV